MGRGGGEKPEKGGDRFEQKKETTDTRGYTQPGKHGKLRKKKPRRK